MIYKKLLTTFFAFFITLILVVSWSARDVLADPAVSLFLQPANGDIVIGGSDKVVEFKITPNGRQVVAVQIGLEYIYDDITITAATINSSLSGDLTEMAGSHDGVKKYALTFTTPITQGVTLATFNFKAVRTQPKTNVDVLLGNAKVILENSNDPLTTSNGGVGVADAQYNVVTATASPSPSPSASLAPRITGVTGLPACISTALTGAQKQAASINWTPASGSFWVNISQNSSFPSPYYHKESAASPTDLSGFNLSDVDPPQEVNILPGTAYYIKVFDQSTNQTSPSRQLNIPACVAAAIVTTQYRIAENPADLGRAQWQSYTSEPLPVDFEFKDKTPGPKFVWVEFKDSTNRIERRSAQIKLLGADPKITSCALSFEGNNTILNLTGENFGVVKGEIKSGEIALQSREWKNSSIKAVLPNAPAGQTIPVSLTNTDGQIGEGQCSAISLLSLGAKFFCRQPSSHVMDNVDLTLAGAYEGGTKVKQKVKIDKDGVIEGLNVKLESGKNYKLSLKAPKSLRRTDSFTAGDGTTNISNFVLPVGDIFPADGGDGSINSFDKSVLNSQWIISTDVAGRSGDFNQDGRVNSFDWACMRYDFNKSDDSEPAPGGPPASSPNPGTGGSSTASPSPSPSASGSSANSQANVRDTKRKADLQVIQNALEQYRADNNHYPTAKLSGQSISLGSKVYLDKVPSDPLNPDNDLYGWVYRYEPNPVPYKESFKSDCNNTDKFCDRYIICAFFESNPPGNSPSMCSSGGWLNCKAGSPCSGGVAVTPTPSSSPSPSASPSPSPSP